jgi:hypothetical protein
MVRADSEEAKNTHYEDFDWDELPADVKEMAMVLGWDKATWDNDGKPPSENKDWEELTSAERAAAERLGFTEETWSDDGFCCC